MNLLKLLGVRTPSVVAVVTLSRAAAPERILTRPPTVTACRGRHFAPRVKQSPIRCILTPGKLSVWLKDAQHLGLYAMQPFARTLRSDIDAVRNAIIEQWSNGQTEGQINRLKTLKRAMYGRAGTEVLRARMLPV